MGAVIGIEVFVGFGKLDHGAGVEPGKRIQRAVYHAQRNRAHAVGVVKLGRGHAVVAQKLVCFEGDFFHLITDALQIHNHPAHRQHKTQIAGGRLAARDNGLAGIVDFHFELVDVGIAINDFGEPAAAAFV